MRRCISILLDMKGHHPAPWAVLAFLLIHFTGCGNPPSPDSADITAPAIRTTGDTGAVTNSIGMELVLIPAGRFQMGTLASAPDVRADETPRREVAITRPFHIGRYEVTQAEYEQLFPDRKSFFRWPDGGGKDRVVDLQTDRFPAELVKWIDAVEFCQRLSALPKEEAAGRVYRLPTEAEWEYACRAGTQTAFHYGNALSSTRANFIGTEPFGDASPGPFLNRTNTVGSYPPNDFGLYDMHGNVWEWCSDWYDRDYYKQAPAKNPPGPQKGSRKVIRGGDWYSDGRDCRSAFRYAGLPRGTFYATGMRVVMHYGKRAETLPSLPDPATAEVQPELSVTDHHTATGGGVDWPRWRGIDGNGSWTAASLATEWPANGLPCLWRQPLGGGYGGVAVANGRVYVMDRQQQEGPRERLLCFDADSGALLWKHQYRSEYGEMAYANGPRTTPAVVEGVVYTVGAAGQLASLDAIRGTPIWTRNLLNDDQAPLPAWGFCSSPFIWRNLLMIQAGAPQDRCLLALNPQTGETVWHSLSDQAGYSTPLVIAAEPHAQMVCWTPTHIRSVNARTGQPLWSIPFAADSGMSIAMPVFHDNLLLVTGYYNGTIAIRPGRDSQEPTIVWQNRRELRGHMAQPLCRGGYGYLLDRRHGVTCFEVQTGRKLWDAENRVTAKARNPHATMVWVDASEHALILNSDGELILASLTPQGYVEHARSTILGETWAHPAYSGQRVYARSDTEIVCFALPGPSSESAGRPIQ